MNQTGLALASAVVLSSHPYSCHKTTPQEAYAHDKHCVAALDANLKIVPAARLKQVGLDPGAVDLVSRGNTSGAYDWGKRLGMSPDAIHEDLERAGAAYLKSHTWQPPRTARGKFVALGYDLNDCLLDYYGRPND
jgi:hypothetical protein